jgi:hypothetical protein
VSVDEFLQDASLVKFWHEELAKNETLKMALGAMDESSPLYRDYPETAGQSTEAKYWFLRGYTYYPQKLKEMGKLAPVRPTIKATYGVKDAA